MPPGHIVAGRSNHRPFESDRGGRAPDRRLSYDGLRWCTGPGRRGRKGRQVRQRPTPDRHSALHQGRALHQGPPHHLRLEDPGILCAGVRCHRYQPLEGSGRHYSRQGQHGRVRHGLQQRKLRLRRAEESGQHRLCLRRQQRRLRRFGGGRRMYRLAGHRHRRFHPPARFLLRGGRLETDLWPGFALRTDRLCLLPRPDRPHHQGRARLYPAAQRHQRL